MSKTIILAIVLILSLSLNAILIWYSRKVTSKVSFVYENIGEVSDIIANYRVHLKSVYEMEMFYGDETLQYLMDHTRSIRDILEDYEDSEFFLEPIDEESKDTPSNQEEQIDGEKKESIEKDVFYAGTRRRDS